jgi:hypothetical protein
MAPSHLGVGASGKPGRFNVAEALRELVDAVLAYPGAKRGDVSMDPRGNLAAFMRLDAAVEFLNKSSRVCSQKRYAWGRDGIVGCVGNNASLDHHVEQSSVAASVTPDARSYHVMLSMPKMHIGASV